MTAITHTHTHTQIASVSKDVENWKSQLVTVCGLYNGETSMEKSVAVPPNVKQNHRMKQQSYFWARTPQN